jgi:hypothetical protein
MLLNFWGKRIFDRVQSNIDKIVPVLTSNALVILEVWLYLFLTSTPERVSSECPFPAALPSEKETTDTH